MTDSFRNRDGQVFGGSVATSESGDLVAIRQADGEDDAIEIFSRSGSPAEAPEWTWVATLEREFGGSQPADLPIAIVDGSDEWPNRIVVATAEPTLEIHGLDDTAMAHLATVSLDEAPSRLLAAGPDSVLAVSGDGSALAWIDTADGRVESEVPLDPAADLVRTDGSLVAYATSGTSEIRVIGRERPLDTGAPIVDFALSSGDRIVVAHEPQGSETLDERPEAPEAKDDTSDELESAEGRPEPAECSSGPCVSVVSSPNGAALEQIELASDGTVVALREQGLLRLDVASNEPLVDQVGGHLRPERIVALVGSDAIVQTESGAVVLIDMVGGHIGRVQQLHGLAVGALSIGGSDGAFSALHWVQNGRPPSEFVLTETDGTIGAVAVSSNGRHVAITSVTSDDRITIQRLRLEDEQLVDGGVIPFVSGETPAETSDRPIELAIGDRGAVVALTSDGAWCSGLDWCDNAEISDLVDGWQDVWRSSPVAVGILSGDDESVVFRSADGRIAVCSPAGRVRPRCMTHEVTAPDDSAVDKIVDLRTDPYYGILVATPTGLFALPNGPTRRGVEISSVDAGQVPGAHAPPRWILSDTGGPPTVMRTDGSLVVGLPAGQHAVSNGVLFATDGGRRVRSVPLDLDELIERADRVNTWTPSDQSNACARYDWLSNCP